MSASAALASTPLTPPIEAPSFEVPAETHRHSLFNYAYRLSDDKQTAEGLVQDSLLRAWRSRDRGATAGALIDIRLPDGDGRELSARLAYRVPDLEIVLMSGAHDLQPDPGLAPHVRAFLSKPVNLNRIYQLFVRAGERRLSV